MAKQTFTTGQVLTAAQVNSLQANDFNQTVSIKTASYTLVAADKGTRIEFNTSGSVTCTVNTGIFDAGDTVIIQNRGAGDVTVTAGTATVDTAGSLVLSQYQSGTLYFISASASIFFAAAVGDLTAVTSGTGISISNAGGPVPTITNSMATEISAKGDLIVGTGSGTFDNLAVGTNGYTLVADSSTSTGLKWAAPAGGGKVLQVVSALITTDTTIASTTLTDTAITLSITPSSATSKVLVMISANFTAYRSSDYAYGKYKIFRGATAIWDATFNDVAFGIDTSGSGATFNRLYSQPTWIYLDSPATTSSTTYKLQAAAYVTTNSGAVRFQPDTNPSSITLLEIGA